MSQWVYNVDFAALEARVLAAYDRKTVLYGAMYGMSWPRMAGKLTALGQLTGCSQQSMKVKAEEHLKSQQVMCNVSVSMMELADVRDFDAFVKCISQDLGHQLRKFRNDNIQTGEPLNPYERNYFDPWPHFIAPKQPETLAQKVAKLEQENLNLKGQLAEHERIRRNQSEAIRSLQIEVKEAKQINISRQQEIEVLQTDNRRKQNFINELDNSLKTARGQSSWFEHNKVSTEKNNLTKKVEELTSQLVTEKSNSTAGWACAMSNAKTADDNIAKVKSLQEIIDTNSRKPLYAEIGQLNEQIEQLKRDVAHQVKLERSQFQSTMAMAGKSDTKRRVINEALSYIGANGHGFSFNARTFLDNLLRSKDAQN